MILQTCNILITIIALLYCNAVTTCETSWIDIVSKGVQSINGNFGSGKDKDNPTPSEKIPPCVQKVFGPHLPNNGCPKYELLESKNIEAIRRQIEQCTNLSIACDSAKSSKFRTIDGSCNNLQHPTWGMGKICLKRILPFDYADNVSSPRESCTGKPLPNARHVSNVFHSVSAMEYSEDLTNHFMQWGQIIGHDVSLNDLYKTPESGFNIPINCCEDGEIGGTPIYNDKCTSIAPPPSDPFYSKYGVTCMNFARTIPCQNCSGGQRIHLNNNTAYHDLSIVYGSSPSLSQELRSNKRGMMRVECRKETGPLLPTTYIEDVCISPPNETRCYHSGDTRTDQHLFLLTMQTSLLRHHNFICQQLFSLNPHWDDERIYQEARRINIAIAQWISYKYYLPHVLGEGIMRKEGLYIFPGAKYTKYNPDLDPSITDDFTVWAQRYGHTQIPNLISEIDPKTDKNNTIMLRDYFFYPFEFRYGQYDKIATGMTVDKPKKRDVSLADDVRNYLYKIRNESGGQDLAALSILRGREHGIPGYTYYLCYLLRKTVRTFDDLRGLMPVKLVQLLKGLYDSVHDIDTYSGAFAEYSIPGGFVGPTIAAVLTAQYKSLKYGDRYWFEHGNQAGSFTPSQLLEIKSSSLARVLCDTTKIEKIQRNVFLPPTSRNPTTPCEKINKFNFALWKE